MEKKCYEAPSMGIIIVEAQSPLNQGTVKNVNSGGVFESTASGSDGTGDDSPRGRESGWDLGYDFDVEDWEE